jgi:hypothetical protein
LIKYENNNDDLCFWRCLAYHIIKPSNVRRVETKVNQLFNKYYGKKQYIKAYTGIQYVAYGKEYTDERLDADDYDDELEKVENF